MSILIVTISSSIGREITTVPYSETTQEYLHECIYKNDYMVSIYDICPLIWKDRDYIDYALSYNHTSHFLSKYGEIKDLGDFV